MIAVLVVPPRGAPFLQEVENDERAIRALAGGKITAYCDRDGQYVCLGGDAQQEEPNRRVQGVVIRGNAYILKVSVIGEFHSMGLEDADGLLRESESPPVLPQVK